MLKTDQYYNSALEIIGVNSERNPVLIGNYLDALLTCLAIAESKHSANRKLV